MPGKTYNQPPDVNSPQSQHAQIKAASVQELQKGADIQMYQQKIAQVESEIAERQRVLADLKARVSMLSNPGTGKIVHTDTEGGPRESWMDTTMTPQAGGVSWNRKGY